MLKDINIDKTLTELHEHMTETGVLDNHIYILIKSVTRNYIKIRMHHMAKEANQTRIKNERIRQKMNKLILFKNQ